MNGDVCVMKLIRDIDRNPAVQAYLQRTSDAVASLIGRIAVVESDSVSGAYYKTHQAYTASVLAMMHMGSAEDPLLSGSVAKTKVSEVLERGNLRERCGVFFNLFCGSQVQGVLEKLRWYTCKSCNRTGLPLPRCICMDQLLKLQLDHRTQDPWHASSQPPQRMLRAPYMQEKYALPLQRVLPPLSEREQRCCRIIPRGDQVFMGWQTGHMRWEIDASCDFARDARHRSESTIAGQSGHTFMLMRAMRIFEDFCPETWTLICIVWLVGADHHSVHEVVSAAQHLGLRHHAHLHSVQTARLLLHNVQERVGNIH